MRRASAIARQTSEGRRGIIAKGWSSNFSRADRRGLEVGPATISKRVSTVSEFENKNKKRDHQKRCVKKLPDFYPTKILD
jgi:hypothetical protein